MTANESGRENTPNGQRSTASEQTTATHNNEGDTLAGERAIELPDEYAGEGEATRRVLGWIADLDDERYVKSAEIADATDLSANQVGCVLALLSDRDDGPDIAKWTSEGTSPVTWVITPEREVTVYRASSRGGSERLLHSERDCRELANAKRVHDKPLSVFPDPEFCSVCGPPEGVEREVVADGGTEGAIDNEFDEAEQSPRAQLEAGRLDIGAASYDGMVAGDVAIDLVTRQPLRVRGCVADGLVEYYEDTGFDLYNYKQHPFLPVTLDDSVYECVFIGSVDDLHSFSTTYDYPAGRLARVPTELAGGDD